MGKIGNAAAADEKRTEIRKGFMKMLFQKIVSRWKWFFKTFF